MCPPFLFCFWVEKRFCFLFLLWSWAFARLLFVVLFGLRGVSLPTTLGLINNNGKTILDYFKLVLRTIADFYLVENYIGPKTW